MNPKFVVGGIQRTEESVKNGANFTTEDYSPQCVQTWRVFVGFGGFGFMESVFWPSPELPSCLSCMEITCLLNCSQPFIVMELWWGRRSFGREYFSHFFDITNYVKLASEKCCFWTEQIEEQQKRSSQLWERKWKYFWGFVSILEILKRLKEDKFSEAEKGSWTHRTLQKHDLNVLKLFLRRVKWGSLNNRNEHSKIFDLMEKLELIQWPGRALLFMSWSSALIELLL